MPTIPQILIVDLGSQLTLVIARLLRDEGHRSVVKSPKDATKWMKAHKPLGIILSGGDRSVYNADAPQPPSGVLATDAPPVLGICYGHQWLAHNLGGRVEHIQGTAEYGPAQISIHLGDPLFEGIEPDQSVWASHGDTVVDAGDHLILARATLNDGISAMRFNLRKAWGVQFHPEVSQTPCGKQILMNFVEGICGCRPNWEPATIVKDTRASVSGDPSMRVILGFSGGVDSSTIAATYVPVLGERLLGVCVDAGQFREDELEEIRQNAKIARLTLKIVKAKGLFLKALRGITDAEKKREVFKALYVKILKKEARIFKATHVVQGTLATDLVESGKTGGSLIKSHHNVGLNWGKLGELMPVSAFFKYEVRALAHELDLPNSISQREPFPGPGMFIRIVGAPVTKERLDVVRFADHKVREILKNAKDVPEISQLVVGLCCVNTTGVKGEARAYGPAVLVRAVQTADFMTAQAVEFPVEVRRDITSTLTRHKGIVRVWFDEGNKPPATTEFE